MWFQLLILKGKNDMRDKGPLGKGHNLSGREGLKQGGSQTFSRKKVGQTFLLDP
jgi:hypothetical protein